MLLSFSLAVMLALETSELLLIGFQTDTRTESLKRNYLFEQSLQSTHLDVSMIFPSVHQR